jgi:hypothetical protein
VPQFGANVNWLFNDGSYTAGQVSSQLASLHAAGATIARSDALWEASEPSPPVAGVHHYDWAFDDRIALDLAEHGLRWLPIIDYTAPWDESVPGRDHSPPASTADYAAYAGALAARYGPGGTFWSEYADIPALPVGQFEIWNEPDNPEFWAPEPDAARYAQLYAAARASILAADPSATVVVGGLTNPPVTLPALLTADPRLRGEIAGVAIHPYGRDPAVVLHRVANARRALDGVGLGAVPLYVTEFGWTTSPEGALDWAPARLRPLYIQTTLTALAHSGCDLAMVLLYTWATPGSDPADSQHWFGVSPPGAGADADVTAFKDGLGAARGRTATGSRVCGAVS